MERRSRHPSSSPIPRSAALLGVLLVGCGDSTGPERMEPEPDPGVVAIVERLDFEGYKATILGLTQFGDRLQGTQRNLDALDWIEAQLESYGYTNVTRHPYQYQGQPRENIHATKVGLTAPDEMYIVSAHMDGRGGGEAANDDGSGTALVMELARVLGAADIETERSVRFILWNNEETGLNGSAAYAEERAPLQGIEDPPGSGLYPEPRWLGVIQHDMMMFDHGLPPGPDQSPDADIDIEYQLDSGRSSGSLVLARAVRDANELYAPTYPAEIGSNMNFTDSRSFQDHAPSISLRENQRIAEIGQGSNPHWHQPTDLYTTYSDDDFRLGFTAAETTLAAIVLLAGASSSQGTGSGLGFQH